MRILKYIGVFTPEPWQGYGYDDETRRSCAGRPRRSAS
jgi:nitrous-oxide reductase